VVLHADLLEAVVANRVVLSVSEQTRARQRECCRQHWLPACATSKRLYAAAQTRYPCRSLLRNRSRLHYDRPSEEVLLLDEKVAPQLAEAGEVVG
jgi:hypothetical protein